MAERVSVSSNGTFLTDDLDVHGYYVVSWQSEPYTLQEYTMLTDFNPPIQLSAGKFVADAVYYNQVPFAWQWYTLLDLKTKVQMKQVVVPDLILHPISEENKLPSKRVMQQRKATELGTKRIDDDDHDMILEEKACWMALEFDELMDTKSVSVSDIHSNSDSDSDNGDL